MSADWRNGAAIPRAAAALVTSAILVGCTTPRPATQPNIGSGSPASGTTTLTRSNAPPITLTLTRIDAGKTITIHTGDHVKVVLDSTYWTVGHMSGPILHEESPPIVVPKIAHCVPGGGCGTVTANFTAVAVGVATLSADRTTCGEALRCIGNDGTYRVTIVVK